MANPWWTDFYRSFTGAFRKDPLTIKARGEKGGAGITSDSVPNIRGDDFAGSGMVSLRDTTDLVDFVSADNRIARYREYDRLRVMPEIESAMTTIADEACVVGDTQIATLSYGMRSIRWLTENVKEPFLVYCYDFKAKDYTLGWAYDPRKVKTEETIRILLDDGSEFIVTRDHRILLRNGEWCQAGDLPYGAELMPFYKLKSNRLLNNLKSSQFPRIYTHKDGWKHERQFIDEWKSGKQTKKQAKIIEAVKLIGAGVPCQKIAQLMNHAWFTINSWIKKEGFTLDEIRNLAKKKDRRRVVGRLPWNKLDVYDLSVRDHENFCTDSVVMHNCQKNDENNVFKIHVKDENIEKELNRLFFNRKELNVNRRIWSWTKNLCINGDHFLEILINKDNPKDGILGVQELPCSTMFRLETYRARLVEFQQSFTGGPDKQAVDQYDVMTATDEELQSSKATRFSPNQIVHFRVGDSRKNFYPYGVSLIEPARGPAHQLRMMEDAMVVYRLIRAPERRVFYVDIGQLPSHKAEAYIDRLKDQFRKKKMTATTSVGSSALEERWHAPSAEEDYWLPIRPGSQTKIDTLQGAQNLGEVDDTIYFRKKVFTALNFPMTYYDPPDANTTRITLSAQDYKFAKMIERIQDHLVDGLMEIAERHLELLGYPPEAYEDLQLEMTIPSHYKEMSEAEIINQRIGWATQLKSSLLLSDFDVLTKWLHYSEEEALELISRSTLQRYNDAKLQIVMANPALGGIGVPGADSGTELGAEAGGPNPTINPDGEQPPGEPPPDAAGPVPNGGGDKPAPQGGGAGVALAEPTPEEVKRYDLEIQGYSKEQDSEEQDYSEY